MGMYIFYILIILVIMLLFFLVKDKKELLKKLGITSIASGIALIIIGFILRILFNIFLNSFNITRITTIIFNKFFYISIFSLGIGIVMLFISKFIFKHRKKVTSNS